MKYTAKQANWNTGAIITFVGLESIFPYLFANVLNPSGAGTYSFSDLTTGESLASVYSPDGFSHQLVSTNNLPGQEIQPNSVLLQGLFVNNNEVSEFFDQFSISKKLDNMSFALGGYVAKSSVTVENGLGAAALGTIENQPHPIGVTLTDPSDNIYQVTDENGVAGIGWTSFTKFDIDQTQLALFFGHNWQITNRLNFDWGMRYDNVNVAGTNTLSSPGVLDAEGGVDGNSSTIYDNYNISDGIAGSYDKTVSIFSFTGAVNYKLSDNYALYARFANGKKAPDLSLYTNATSEFSIETLDPRAQDLKQIEVGFKSSLSKNLQLVITPFYSLLSNIPTVTPAQNEDGTLYNTPVIFNEMETYGVELETNYKTERFAVRGVFTFQKATAKVWKTWITGSNGSADDTTEDFSGNKADNNPSVMFNIAPSYSITNKFDVYANWRFMGDRPANVAGTFTLPSFSQFDVGLNYRASDRLNFNFNVVNILDGTGVMSWQAPGGFPASLDRQGFTPAQLAANPNSTFGVVSIQPRSFYLTATYQF